MGEPLYFGYPVQLCPLPLESRPLRRIVRPHPELQFVGRVEACCVLDLLPSSFCR